MKNTLLVLSLGTLLSVSAADAWAQGMAVNTTGATANASAIFDAASTTQGMLIPRMTNAQMTAISSPATGLLVYCTDCSPAGFEFYSGSAWTSLNSYSNVTTQGNTFNGASQLVQLNGSSQLPAISGVNLTNLNASNLASGTVPTARLGSGTANSSTFLRGDQTYAAPFTLTTTGTSGAATFSSGTLNIPNYASSSGTKEFMYSGTGNASNSVGTQYAALSPSTFNNTNPYPPSSSSSIVNIFPFAVTVDTLAIVMTIRVASSGTNTFTFTLMDNGSSTGVTATVSQLSTDGVGTIKSVVFSTGTATIPAGDMVYWQVGQSLTGSGNVTFSMCTHLHR